MNIPKIIHQIHLGSSPLSDLEKKWQLSWKKNNPEYIYILWDEQKIAQHIEITHAQAFYDCKNFSEKFKFILDFNKNLSSNPRFENFVLLSFNIGANLKKQFFKLT